jgi:hypothetical protein
MVHRRVSLSAISAFLIPCFVALGAPPAQAKTSRAVTIDQASRHASGWVASRDSLEPIGCRVTHVFGMAGAQCYAVDASGATAQCTTRDRDLVSAAAAARRQGKLTFAWDESGTCTSIVSAHRRNAEI